MLLRTIAIITLIAGQVAVQACLGPENVFGVQLNNGESIDVEVIENLGEEGVNYYKNEANGLLTYSFRSHYNSSIMIEVTTFTDPANNSGVLTFTVDTSVVPIAGFPFGACVRPELDWLVTAGILEMERIKRERIEQSFQNETQRQYPAASYFWTKQDSLIPNNAVFELTENGEVIVAQANCGEIAFAATDLPPEALDISRDRTITKNGKPFIKGFIVDNPNHSAVLFVDIRGRLYGQGSMPVLRSQRSGVLVGYDRQSGMVTKMLRLP